MVIINALVLTPFILHALGFADRGMDWVHGALVAAMLAPTDAVSVTAILKAGALGLRCSVLGLAGIGLGLSWAALVWSGIGLGSTGWQSVKASDWLHGDLKHHCLVML
jgi:hypothetical protein